MPRHGGQSSVHVGPRSQPEFSQDLMLDSLQSQVIRGGRGGILLSFPTTAPPLVRLPTNILLLSFLFFSLPLLLLLVLLLLLMLLMLLLMVLVLLLLLLLMLVRTTWTSLMMMILSGLHGGEG